MCQCGNIFCNNGSICGGRGVNNWPSYNPPFNIPWVSPYAKFCVNPWQEGAYEGPIFPGPYPNRCAPNPCNPCVQNGCLDYPSANCVLTSIAYPCIGSAAGTNLTTVLSLINAALCSLVPPNCGTWTNLVLLGVASAGTIDLPLSSTLSPPPTPTPFTSTPQYSVDGCGNVSLRGFVVQGLITVTNENHTLSTLFDPNVATGGGALAILPVGARPKSLTVIPCFIESETIHFSSSGPDITQIAGWVFVNTDGSIFFGVSSDTSLFLPDSGDYNDSYIFTLSLDSVKFSVN